MHKNLHAIYTRTLFILIVASGCLVSCGEQAAPETPEPPQEVILQTDSGLVSFYGRAFDGNTTASGEVFDSREMLAAHPDYPMGTVVRVTNLENGDTVQVRIADRGPTRVNQQEGVIIDISRGAAEKIRMVTDGRVRGRVDVLQWGAEKPDSSASP